MNRDLQSDDEESGDVDSDWEERRTETPCQLPARPKEPRFCGEFEEKYDPHTHLVVD